MTSNSLEHKGQVYSLGQQKNSSVYMEWRRPALQVKNKGLWGAGVHLDLQESVSYQERRISSPHKHINSSGLAPKVEIARSGKQDYGLHFAAQDK